MKNQRTGLQTNQFLRVRIDQAKNSLMEISIRMTVISKTIFCTKTKPKFLTMIIKFHFVTQVPNQMIKPISFSLQK